MVGLIAGAMKIKYTQGSVHGDVDFALAIALENDSDDDFQPAFLNQALALRSCAVTKQVKEKKAKRRSLKLERKQRGSGEAGDPVRLDDEEGKDVKICFDVQSNFAKKREPKGLEKRVLKDRNSEILNRVGTGAIVVVEGDENANPVRSGKLAKVSPFSAPGLDDSDRIESTDRRSLACDQSELRVSGFDLKRKTESSVHSDGAKKVKTAAEDGLHLGGAKNVKTAAEDVQTDGSGELDSLSFDEDECVRIDLDAEVDEETIICTQIETPVGLESAQGPIEAAVDVVKMTVEDRPKRKYNIYDIVLGNHRTDRVPNSAVEKKGECEGDAVDKQQVECEGNVEEIDSPGTALQALVDEAELDYEALISNGEGNEGMDSFGCPVCGIDLSVDPTHAVELSVSDREQHIGDCSMENNIICGRTNPEDCLIGDFESAQQLSSQQTGRGKALDCPVCGVCIEELSAGHREEHTNACLEKVDMPCVGRNSGDFQPGCTGMEGISQMVTSPRTAMTEIIVCPVCGDSIEELSTAQREAHSNACLDNSKGEGPGEVAKPAAAEVAQALGRPDVGPVVKWLTDLNLGKYVDIFVKEEIDWDTLKWLTEEDLSSLGITALGPRRKIVCAIQELRKPALTAQQKAAMQEAQRLSDSVVVSAIDTLQGSRKSIADFFVSRHTGPRAPAPDSNTLAGPKAAGTTSTAGVLVRNRGQRGPVTAGGNLRSASTSGIPTWMCIPGTSFRVDAFKYTIGNCSHWFLTHFHSDHYQGLTRGFRHGKIFCSSITARLVNLRIGVPFDQIQVLPLNETVFIDGVRVTFIDANHCPGSVMILFEPPNGKAVLHTGDFRFCSDMACNEVLKACPITTLILDTTYCDPQYDFPKQDSITQFVIDAIEAEAFNTKTLFLIGTYTIGKERIFLEVGKALKKYVYVGKAKQRLLDCMDLAEEDRKWLTTKDQQSHIHVVPLWSVASFKRMGSISRHYHGRYNSIVAFSPTGWSFGKDKKRIQGRPGRRYQQGSIIRYEVPYSEHSSFTELKEFVRITSPENIVPSVISSSGLTADAMVASLLSEES